MKPDTADDIPPILTHKPDTKDEGEPVFDKPNTYEERVRLPQEVLDDLIVRAEFVDGKRPAIKTNEDDEEESGGSLLTSHLLSHIPSSTTGLTSSPPPAALSPSASSVSSNSSNMSSATTRLALLKILKTKPMEDLITFDLRKYSLSRPHEHEVYLQGTKDQKYKKIQPHSYSWGFQNILYKTSTEKIKVAEARRRAFKKEITVEWGDFPLLSTEEFNDEEDDVEDDDPITAATENTTKSNQLHNKTNSHLLFTYETEFEGFQIRWKRASLLSHDMVCEVKCEQPQEQKKKWHVIAEFDSHRMGYFVHLGELIIDRNALKLVDRPDHFEAHIVVTCCTLIDLMREVVEKAVGLSKGGVVGSD
ncbi:hypothetical protein INT47_012994 [Mucor saturninus]|uniref:Uncharacterized protein n=1 Tax=Mucor saturninus TaxID=64648 RepID=A0A8H7QYU8_9FUNG|nr:hypothetical protein INT47_012994 [Mucor saturninus]